MKQIMTVIMFLALVYWLPLIGNPEKIIAPQIVFLSLVGAILLCSQPSPSMKEAKRHKSSDRHSFYAIMIAAVVSQIACAVEWSYFPSRISETTTLVTALIGVSMIVSGLAIRIWAIRILGPLFTATVQITRNHVLVTSGPYSIIRHPSYLGAYMTFIGAGLVLNAPLGTALCAALMLLAYRHRISAEESLLGAQFGSVYSAYASHSYRLIPYIW